MLKESCLRSVAWVDVVCINMCNVTYLFGRVAGGEKKSVS